MDWIRYSPHTDAEVLTWLTSYEDWQIGDLYPNASAATFYMHLNTLITLCSGIDFLQVSCIVISIFSKFFNIITL